jgi:formiminoglutamate deiminase
MYLHCEYAWLGGESAASNVRIGVTDGVVTSVERDVQPQPGDERIRGVVMPGLVNAHSHAFHRALRGRTHGGSGDFWQWRNPMYVLANRLTPDSYRELATAVFAEMALAGITGVGEFHYVHHQPDGTPYADPNAMGRAMVEAAGTAGVRLALLDSAYLHAMIDAPDTLSEQRRFSDGTIDRWLDRVDLLGDGGDGWTVGLAPHSVRAVHPNELAEVVGSRFGRVVHLHVSEQPAENAACVAATGMTPTEVLADVGLLGRHLTAVHATHMTERDITLLGGAHAHVCMCPTTERDLADGIGPAHAMIDAGATMCLGSDSHAVIDLFEEARAVEHDERLATGKRGIHAPASLLAAATSGGASSLGWGGLESVGVVAGKPADLIAIGLDSVRMAGFSAQDAAAHIVHAAAPADVRDVWMAGTRIVRDGVHERIPDVAGALRTSISALGTL